MHPAKQWKSSQARQGNRCLRSTCPPRQRPHEWLAIGQRNENMEAHERACAETRQSSSARTTPANQAHGKRSQEDEQARRGNEDDKEIPHEPGDLEADSIRKPMQESSRRRDGHCAADQRNSGKHRASTKKCRERKHGARARTHDDTLSKFGT